MWSDLLVCHCDQSRGFWESQQVKEESQLPRDGEGEPLVTGGVQGRIFRLRGVVRKPRENVRQSQQPRALCARALETRFACALDPRVCTLEPEPDLEISRACSDFC